MSAGDVNFSVRFGQFSRAGPTLEVLQGARDRRELEGWIFGLVAYGLWGVLPMFWKQVQHINPWELLAHRVVWSGVVFAAWLALRRQLPAIRAALADPAVRRRLALSAVLLAGNWFVFVYAVITDRVLDASLGYFINPLVSVAMGWILLGERLRPRQIVAVALAAIGIAFSAWRAGGLPWIALALAGSFGSYGLLRKTTKVPPIAGSAVETLVLGPFALGYVLWLASQGGGSFFAVSRSTDLWLLATGLVTAAPLFAFVNAAPRLRMTTLGFLQYLAPSLQFAVATLIFGEPLASTRLWSFGFVWLGVSIFVVDAVLARRDAANG